VSANSRLRSEAGYSLIELLISSAIMITITGAIFGLVNPAQGTAQTTPEVSDLQQRGRVASDILFKELIMTGAGTYQGPVRGSLVNFFAPIMPRRVGRTNPDAINVFRSDTITLSYIPNTYSQTTISSPMPNVSAELKVTNQPNCPAGQELCGFSEGMEVLIFDTSGNFDTFTITQVQDAAAHLQHHGQDLSYPYDVGASVTQVKRNTYYWCRPNSDRTCPNEATASQLRQYDGANNDVPLVDNVVGLVFDYFGDPNPPLQPKPPLGVENCLYDTAGVYKNLPVLAGDEGSLARLTPAVLTDAVGAQLCGAGSSQFDPDLLRVRKVRVTLRVQVAAAALRGANTLLFRNPGGARESARQVPDYTVSFEVTPRNLNLTR
jgi:Tfp pilus assembly protein PilW